MISLEQVKSTSLPILAAAGAVAGTLGILTPDQLASIKGDLDQIWQGTQLIMKGGGGLLLIGGSLIAGWRASKGVLAARVQASSTEKVVTSDPAVSAAHPEITLTPPGAGSVYVEAPPPPTK